MRKLTDILKGLIGVIKWVVLTWSDAFGITKKVKEVEHIEDILKYEIEAYGGTHGKTNKDTIHNVVECIESKLNNMGFSDIQIYLKEYRDKATVLIGLTTQKGYDWVYTINIYDDYDRYIVRGIYKREGTLYISEIGVEN